ncbi:MAG: glycosyltransferase family 4 protein [Deltaproteobacteria bacterium]|nr:glycosyltransferase family 4 protein [Deltaproteobacteria bacterium]MBW2418155.1 glycosyltransferase family 4 protein [Deltaproteobacteria bacterium]
MASLGGGRVFIANVVPPLVALAPQDQFKLIVRDDALAASIPSAPNLEVESLPPGGMLDRFAFAYREAPRRIEEWGADLYFSFGEYVPLTGSVPRIATFQNACVFSKIRFGWPLYQKFRLALLRLLAGLSARRSARVLFVSQDSERWIGDLVGLAKHRRAWLHHGVTVEEWRPRELPSRAARPYLLSVGSVYRYKNFVRLVEAYATVARESSEPLELVIIGDTVDHPYREQLLAAIEATGELAERIRLIDWVPHEEIPRYYAEASLFVFPSYLETFGIPLLEAMASEIPVVVSDLPVFREICLDAAFYADPFSSDSLASAMSRALGDAAERERCIGRGREIAERLTWDAAAGRLLATFEETLKEGC